MKIHEHQITLNNEINREFLITTAHIRFRRGITLLKIWINMGRRYFELSEKASRARNKTLIYCGKSNRRPGFFASVI
jgi:hypothetical protein